MSASLGDLPAEVLLLVAERAGLRLFLVCRATRGAFASLLPGEAAALRARHMPPRGVGRAGDTAAFAAGLGAAADPDGYALEAFRGGALEGRLDFCRDVARETSPRVRGQAYLEACRAAQAPVAELLVPLLDGLPAGCMAAAAERGKLGMVEQVWRAWRDRADPTTLLEEVFVVESAARLQPHIEEWAARILKYLRTVAPLPADHGDDYDDDDDYDYDDDGCDLDDSDDPGNPGGVISSWRDYCQELQS